MFLMYLREGAVRNRSQTAARYWDATFNFLLLATALCTYYHNNVGLLFNFTPKFHYLAHIAYYAK